MNGLGRLFNYIHIGDSVIVDLDNVGAVTVFAYESSAEAVISVKRRKDGGSPVVIPDTITEYWTSDGAGGAWSRQTQTAADEVTKSSAAAQSIAAIELDVAKHILSDDGDYNQVEVEVDGSATVSIITHDLLVQRAPQNLPAAIGT